MASSTLLSVYARHGGTTAVFSGKVAAYQRARPDYPAALFDAVIKATGLAPGTTVLDLGAGTGLLSRDWLARGYRVLAVEPNDEMRAAAEQLLGADARFASGAGRAEATGLPDACADLAIAAQAFHWFDPLAARAECRRVLRGPRWAALVWNDRRPGDPVNAGLDGICARHGGARRAAMVANERTDASLSAFFGHAPTPVVFPHAHRLDAAGFEALVFSRSYMPARDAAAGEAAAADVAALFSALAVDGAVTVPYDSTLYLGRLA
ncbi:MAG: class I SAM-dependent methyltransferase [Burkholderiaceae bacterium]|jgi:SAM-dependent methyltransferase|nr:class I SAM-dependent methyltransferase [Burkholderiaceae bacterium]